MGEANLNYEEKISLLDGADFFALFSSLGVEPRWVMSAGKQSIQMIGACHHGEGYSALFDPDTLKVTCFSACGQGMFLHTWIRRALGFNTNYEAIEFLEDWMDGKDIDWSTRTSRAVDFSHHYSEYEPSHIEPIQGMPQVALDEIYSKTDTSIETLSKLVWCTEDGIRPDILQQFDVGYYKPNGTILLPHHNINGEIVGIYERSFKPLRKEIKKKYPEIDFRELIKFPRAKYVPLLRSPEWQTEEKSSWSFPNTFNLYGLHLAKDAIKESKKAIIFEGAKSVMLAHEFGYPFSVASHTFGANLNHISMLIECGAEEIILAFDKQYQELKTTEWELYQKKTVDLAEKVKKYVKVSRICDKENILKYKDAPIDEGKETFEYLFDSRERLTKTAEEEQQEAERLIFNPQFTQEQIEERDKIGKQGDGWSGENVWTIPLSSEKWWSC